MLQRSTCPAPKTNRRGVARASGRRGIAVLALITAALPLAASCRSSGPDRGRLFSKVVEPRWTEAQLRVALYDYVVRFTGVVNETANEMAAASESKDVKQKALLWKVNVVPACQSAAFDADPVVGLVDTWALVVQMNDFFESAEAEALLGDAASIGHEATTRLQSEIEAIAVAAGGEDGADLGRRRVREFAAAHPIEDLDFTHASVAPELVQVTELTRKGVLATVETLEGRIEDLTARMTIYAAHAPRQARWEAEVFTQGLLDLPELARLVSLPDEVPNVVAQEREIVLETLRAEREAVLADVERQRIDTLGFVSGERDAILAAVANERGAVAAALGDERRAVLEDVERQRTETIAAIREERIATLDWAEEQRRAVIEDVARATNATVDRVLWKGFLYGLGVAAIPCLLLCTALVIGRGRVSLDLTKRE